jgi:TonB family protein
MRFVLFVYFLNITCLGFAQQQSSTTAQVSKTYFKGFFDRVKSPQKGADFVETVTPGPDSTTHVEIRHITLDQIVLDAFLKKEEPVGIWYYHLANGGRILNYDFELVYGSAAPDSADLPLYIPAELGITNYLEDVPEKKYVAPKLATGDADLAEFMQNNLTFPYYSMVSQIYGKVLVGLQIDETGTVSNVKIENGVNVYLDKEALRIMKKMRFKSAPQLDGQPKRVYYRLYISFFQ